VLEVGVGCHVGLDVLLATAELGDEETSGSEEDAKEVDDVVDMVFEIVDGCGDVYFLFGEAADVLTIHSPPCRQMS